MLMFKARGIACNAERSTSDGQITDKSESQITNLWPNRFKSFCQIWNRISNHNYNKTEELQNF